MYQQKQIDIFDPGHAPFPQRWAGSTWATCPTCGVSFDGGIPSSHRCTAGVYPCRCCTNAPEFCLDGAA